MRRKRSRWCCTRWRLKRRPRSGRKSWRGGCRNDGPGCVIRDARRINCGLGVRDAFEASHMMAADLSRALDPVLLALDVGITPDPWQAEVLRDQPRRLLMLCSRQAG